MNSFCARGRRLLVVVAILTIAAFRLQSASAEPVVKLIGDGRIELSSDGPSQFVLEGNASHLGKCTCYGEATFAEGEEAGSLVGVGVAVIVAANGDLLVGVVNWQIDADGTGQIAFSWRDSVAFSDETTVATTGRFVKSRPAGAVSRLSIKDGTSNTIIAILIG